jgi:hypothetical protein
MNNLFKMTTMTFLVVIQASCERRQYKENKDFHLASPSTSSLPRDVKFFQILSQVNDSIAKARANFAQDTTSPYWSLDVYSRNQNGSANSNKIGVIYFKQNARNRGPDISLDLDDFDEEMINIFLTDQRSLKGAFSASAPGQTYPAHKLVTMLTQQAEMMNDPHLKNLAQSLNDFASFFAGSYTPNGTRPTTVYYKGIDPENKVCHVTATFDGDGSILQISAGYDLSRATFKSAFYLWGVLKVPYDKCFSLAFDSNSELTNGHHLLAKDRKIDLVLKLKRQYANKQGEISGTNINANGYIGLPASGGACEVTRFKLCANQAHLTQYSVGVGAITFMPYLAGPTIGKMEIDCRNLSIIKVD